MGTDDDNSSDEVYSTIGDKGDVGFLDYADDKSLHAYNPSEEGPLVISVPFPFVNGKPQSTILGETSVDTIAIKNTTSDPILLWSVRIFSSNPEGSYILSLMEPPPANASEEAIHGFVGTDNLDDMTLQPGQSRTIWLSCKPKQMGLQTAVVHFDLENERIERVVFLLAEDSISRALFSNTPYYRAPSRARKFTHDQYVAGARPSRANTQGFRYKLPQYPVPPSLRELVANNEVPDDIVRGLSFDNYSRCFSALIAIEEIHLEEEMRAHDMECVTMKRRGNHFLSLQVPGLAERRPSLVCGDFIFAQLISEGPENGARPYQGFIHKVEADEIFLKFDKDLHQRHRDDDLYNVSFTYNRINMRRLYQAIYAAERLGCDLLFPSSSAKRRVIKRSPFKPLNPYLNKEQIRSVEMILGCKGAPPYVIHGPPGTGKTVTMVEAILQIYTTRRKAHILVCASSNSAADHVLEKLLGNEIGTKQHEIFRLNAASRPYEDVNPEFLQFCFYDDMTFKCPPLKALLQYKIILSTYMSTSQLYAEGIHTGHFSHIFLDEAGQASEPETMVPVSNLCRRETVIVLAGDPMQLGPVIYSRNAQNYGLGISYLERLFDCESYEKGDENYVTKLVRNYRCHPAILELPSKLFYNGELIACKEDNESPIYDWEELPNKAFPLLFVGIQGCDEREGNNPSWFNRIEASKVVEIIGKLKTSAGLTHADIGVITPYRQQVLKLKKALDSLDMSELKVGSVEQFQGQERKVIIISTVRSTVKHNEFDRTHNLGFLKNPRRFNVSTTRAKILLIIVGNPHIISKDPNWDRLLRHCAENGSYQGCPLPPPESHSCSDDRSGSYFMENENAVYNQQEWAQNQYSGGVEWGEDSGDQYLSEVARGEDTGNQHSKEVEWGEDVPQQYSNNGQWGEDTAEHCAGEGGCSNEHPNTAEWGNDASNQYSNEAGWGGDTSNSHSFEEHGKYEEDHNNHSTGTSSTVKVNDTSNSQSFEEYGKDEDHNNHSTGTSFTVKVPRGSNFGWGD